MCAPTNQFHGNCNQFHEMDVACEDAPVSLAMRLKMVEIELEEIHDYIKTVSKNYTPPLIKSDEDIKP